jgi:uncharacterized protein
MRLSVKAMWSALVLLSIAATFPVVATAADDEPYGASYLTPFPTGDLYNIAVIGDEMADGLQAGLLEILADNRRLAIRPKRLILNGLNRPDHSDKMKNLEDSLKTDPPQIAIVMLGAWDRVSLRDAQNGKRIAVGSPEWRTDYGARADRLMKALKRSKASVYWVGLPNARGADTNDDMQMINDVIREKLFLNGQKYIDAYAGFLDERGGYDAYGPDMTGKIVRLRDGEGVYFTMSGYRKLAHFVDRDLRRDLVQARTERDIPLVGTDVEQSKINPDKVKLADPATSALPKNGEAPATAASATEAANSAPGEQKADPGKITLKIQNGGREESLTLDIVRPAIPASVVQLVTRRESADKPAQMGETLVQPIAGGLLVMNSVTPPAATARSSGGQQNVSAAQTPYFRVLFRGERLVPRSGRGDEAVWPRPAEPATITPEVIVPPTAKALTTGSTDPTDATGPTKAFARAFQKTQGALIDVLDGVVCWFSRYLGWPPTSPFGPCPRHFLIADLIEFAFGGFERVAYSNQQIGVRVIASRIFRDDYGSAARHADFKFDLIVLPLMRKFIGCSDDHSHVRDAVEMFLESRGAFSDFILNRAATLETFEGNFKGGQHQTVPSCLRR